MKGVGILIQMKYVVQVHALHVFCTIVSEFLPAVADLVLSTTDQISTQGLTSDSYTDIRSDIDVLPTSNLITTTNQIAIILPVCVVITVVVTCFCTITVMVATFSCRWRLKHREDNIIPSMNEDPIYETVGDVSEDIHHAGVQCQMEICRNDAYKVEYKLSVSEASSGTIVKENIAYITS